MLVQPKILTVIIASPDSAKTYTTIRSVQQMRYRNHEIVCTVPYERDLLRHNLLRDFNWLPLITAPRASLSTLLSIAVERGRYSNVDAVCFIQSGCTPEREFLAEMAVPLRTHTNIDLFMPSMVRPDDKGIVFGATRFGKWPHQMKSVIEIPEDELNIANSHFLGHSVLVRLSTCLKNQFSDINDDLTLLYWTEKIINNKHQTMAISSIKIFFDGVIFPDLSSALVVPKGWYKDMERYIQIYGSWYDKVGFVLRYRWRREGSLFSRLVDSWWQNQAAYKREF
ncbi:MAG: hypothetical protein WC773_03370 [Patescibacteria group bacterium]|jgi:hypothetical protein